MAECSTQLSVTFDEDDGRELGEYVLVVETAAGRGECRFTLGPVDDDSGPGGAQAGGAGGEGNDSPAECTGVLSLITERSSERFSGFYLTNFSVSEEPPLVTFSVTLDGVELISERFAPDYEDEYPNGEGCGPTCPHAQHEFAFDRASTAD